MFPLGTVLFPSAVLPLHIFEPRYRELVKHCLDGDREFGVVMIERGSEVGGGDVRSRIGTCARILQAEEFDDGRWGLITVGDRRIQVCEWLQDQPYPCAEVRDWPDPPLVDAGRERTEAESLYESVVSQLRRLLAWNAEMGIPAAPATVELDDDPALGSYQVAAVGPFSVYDRQTLLGAPTATERLTICRSLLEDEAAFAEAQAQQLADGHTPGEPEADER